MGNVNDPKIIQSKISLKPEKAKSENINKITNKIYLGNLSGAKDYSYFKTEGITHILSILGSDDYEPQEPPEMKELNFTRKLITVDDNANANLIQYFGECIDFIEEGEKVYVHCIAGVSRSSSIVIAYLLWKYQCGYKMVYNYINEKRQIKPNKGFVEQLNTFENLLKKNNYDYKSINYSGITVKQFKNVKNIKEDI